MSFPFRILMLVWAGATCLLVLATLAPRLLAVPPALAAYTDCAVPCFLGIIPGQTTAADAERILENHPATYITLRSADRGTLMWHYRSPIPPYFDVQESSRIVYDPATGRIQSLQANIQLPLWQVAASVPLLPTRQVLYSPRFSWLEVDGWRYGVHIYARGDDNPACPADVRALWTATAYSMQLTERAEVPPVPTDVQSYWWTCR